jgi:hypothetical protein
LLEDFILEGLLAKLELRIGTLSLIEGAMAAYLEKKCLEELM